MKQNYFFNPYRIDFIFKQNQDNFFVEEKLDVKLARRGDFKLLKIKKKNLSTIELIKHLASVLKCDTKYFKYAGLKDKHATTIQYITIPKWLNIKKYKNSENVTVTELGFVKEPLRIGSLKENSFKIILNNIKNHERFFKAVDFIKQYGFPNFFGYQRFGRYEDFLQKAKKIAKEGKKAKTQEAKILLAAYQAYYFNKWLEYRIKLSVEIMQNQNNSFLSPTLLNILQNTPTLFKLLPGDLGFFVSKKEKTVEVKHLQKFHQLFYEKKFIPTGVLFGSNVPLAKKIAKEIEKDFIDRDFYALKGSRRAAWVFPKNLHIFIQKEKIFLQFTLPPGSYATVLIASLQK